MVRALFESIAPGSGCCPGAIRICSGKAGTSRCGDALPRAIRGTARKWAAAPAGAGAAAAE